MHTPAGPPQKREVCVPVRAKPWTAVASSRRRPAPTPRILIFCYPASAPHLPQDDHHVPMMFPPGPGVRLGFLVLPITRPSSQHFLLAGVRSQIPFPSLPFSEYFLLSLHLHPQLGCVPVLGFSP